MNVRLAIGLSLLASGCTTAGPFVTSISSDGRGNLIVEKSMVQYNGFTGTVSNESTTSTSIKLFDKDALDRAMTSSASLQRQPPTVWTGETN